MALLKIGIVEDNMIIADAIAELLLDSGYEVTEPAISYGEALTMIEEERPDLLLIDIHIHGKLDGIEIARTVKKGYGTPFIFLTANTDVETITRAKEVVPAAYLAKPITKGQLFAAIEIAMANAAISHQTDKEPAAQVKPPLQTLFIKVGYNFRKVAIDEIEYVESGQNYLTIYLSDGEKAMQRGTLKDFTASVDPLQFMQVHRCYLVAIGKITDVLPDVLKLKTGATVPLSRSNRPELMKRLGLKS